MKRLFGHKRDFNVFLRAKGESINIRIKNGKITRKNLGAHLGGNVRETIEADSVRIRKVKKAKKKKGKKKK